MKIGGWKRVKVVKKIGIFSFVALFWLWKININVRQLNIDRLMQQESNHIFCLCLYLFVFHFNLKRPKCCLLFVVLFGVCVTSSSIFLVCSFLTQSKYNSQQDMTNEKGMLESSCFLYISCFHTLTLFIHHACTFD